MQGDFLSQVSYPMPSSAFPDALGDTNILFINPVFEFGFEIVESLFHQQMNSIYEAGLSPKKIFISNGLLSDCTFM